MEPNQAQYGVATTAAAIVEAALNKGKKDMTVMEHLPNDFAKKLWLVVAPGMGKTRLIYSIICLLKVTKLFDKTHVIFSN